jgi:peptide-methionine (S)-S-oxide reductase
MDIRTKLLPVFVVIGGAAMFLAFGRAGWGLRPMRMASADAKQLDVGTDPGRIREGETKASNGHQLAMVSGGCFWGVENRFRHIPGVVATAVGYTGGHTTNPTYEQVCSHTTGHAETVLVEFDPARVSYAKLLASFLGGIDPTTKDRQGPDVGSSYRSAIWTFGDDQAQAARDAIAQLQKRTSKPIVTTVAPAGTFYLAEEYHQQYDEKNGVDSCPVGG